MFSLSLHGFSYPALSRFKNIHVRLTVDFKLDIGVNVNMNNGLY